MPGTEVTIGIKTVKHLSLLVVVAHIFSASTGEAEAG